MGCGCKALYAADTCPPTYLQHVSVIMQWSKAMRVESS